MPTPGPIPPDSAADGWSAQPSTAAVAMRLTMPVALLLVVSVLAVAGVLLLSAREQDRAAADQSARMLSATLDLELERLGSTARDYAGWDDAAENLAQTVNADWAAANLNVYMRDTFGVTRVLVVNRQDVITYAEADGGPVPVEGLTVDDDLRSLIRTTREGAPGLPIAGTGIVRFDGGLFLTAAADIRWQERMELPDPAATLVLMRPFDTAHLKFIGAPLMLQNLEVAIDATPPQGMMSAALTTPTGTVVGHAVWSPPAPARAFLDSVRWFLLLIIGVMVTLMAVFLSRTQRAVAEQADMSIALRRSQEQYRRLLETVPDLVGLLQHGRITLLNAGGVAMLGLGSPRDAEGRVFADFIGEEERTLFQRLVEAPSRNRRLEWTPFELRRTDRRSVPVELTLLPVDASPDSGVMIMARDRSEQAESRERLRLAQAQAALADRAKGQFLANISHELRTPLNAIIGFSEILRDELLGSLGSPQYRDYATDIHEGGLHLLRLVNDLLDLARIDAGQLELREAWIDIQALVDRCIRLVGQKAGDQGVTMSVDVAEQGQRVLADEIRLKQVIVNLLSNAIRFSERGDHVTVSAGLDTNGDFTLRITDQGLGMTPEAVRLALQPFSQVEGGHNRRQPGAGLGLPLAKGYVEAHGGSLIVTSTPGLGTTVIVTLPKSRVYQPLAARAG